MPGHTDPNAGLDDLQMMLAPESWPNFIKSLEAGLLPLKHPDGLDLPNRAGLGVLMASRVMETWTYQWEWKASLHDLDRPTPRIEHIALGGQELVRLLVQCGWVVD